MVIYVLLLRWDLNISNKFEHVDIKAAHLGIESSFSTIPMPVYIQSHAQQRLAERLDCLEQGYVEFFVYNSLKNLKYFKDKNGNPLIEYNYFGFETGYLRADIHHRKIIIRTFLFLPITVRPRAEKLNEFNGLSKLDHKYLNISLAPLCQPI